MAAPAQPPSAVRPRRPPLHRSTARAQPGRRAAHRTPCVSPLPPFAFSGSTSFTSTSTLSCLSLTAANAGTDVITGSSGRTSTFAYNRTVTIVQGQTVVTLTGSITAGDFAGATGVETITSVSLDLTACTTTQGITSTYGVSELTITGL